MLIDLNDNGSKENILFFLVRKKVINSKLDSLFR